MKLLRMGGVIGYILGTVVLLPLILLVYNYFFINKNDAQKYLQQYLSNTTEIKLTVPKFNPLVDTFSHESKRIETKVATKNMGRDGSEHIYMEYKVVKQDSLKKYIQIVTFFGQGMFWGSVCGNTLLVKINKEDLINPFYGTKEHPLLAFGVLGIEGTLLFVDEDGKPVNNVDYSTTPEQYEYNAKMYLTYVMSKKEFKERFEKAEQQ